jgi:UDP-GlcNAc3NAcA epimerase
MTGALKILSVVGARPQFVKAAAICRAVSASNQVGRPLNHVLVHTGQHYDTKMSQIFFEDLDIPVPDYNLEVGSASHAVQTGLIMERLEPVLDRERPDWILLYGDTNSTVAGALAAAKMNLPTAHIEAGLRSFNRRMPEEINRVVTDSIADVLFCPTAIAMENLVREGAADRAVLTGDIMYDSALLSRRSTGDRVSNIANMAKKSFALATVHRAENTDDAERLLSIVDSLEYIAESRCPVILPLHPRTRAKLAALGWSPRKITILDPVGYLDMIALEDEAKLILTDSGGVQKEAYFFETPCITLRGETEWLETLDNGCNVLAGADHSRIVAAFDNAPFAGPWTAVYGDGRSADTMLNELARRTVTPFEYA